MELKRLVIDFETRSKSPLKREGAFKYSLDPTTRPTCMSFKIWGRQKVYFLDFYGVNKHWEDVDREFRTTWMKCLEEGYLFTAHNAFFELCIYENVSVKRYGWPEIPRRQYRCSAAKAAACALPRNLAGAGEAMNLRVQKDKRGMIAVMLSCKPTRQWNAWKKANDELAAGKRMTAKRVGLARAEEPPMFITPESHPDVFRDLYAYNIIDTRAEEELDSKLPDLHPVEQEIWFLNQKLNWRGLNVDISTVKKIVGILNDESKIRLKELDSLTMGLVTKPGARKKILEFLALDDIVIPDIKAKTVDDLLKEGKVNGDMKRLLELRKELSKTSTRKYQSFLDRAWDDGRVRDILMYHGASTGRDTGTGVQPHNFPRGVINIPKDRPYAPVENVIECDVEMLKILYSENLSMLFSSLLRNMIIATPGHELFVADFSKIEVAVLWWLAGNLEGLKILREGKDPYIYQAAINTGMTYEEIEAGVLREEPWANDARQLGKAQVLGCGFGMGGDKFETTAYDMYRVKLSNKESHDAVKNYREANASVPLMWKSLERAALMAVEHGVKTRANKCVFQVKRGFLWVTLPSGRKLAYRKPTVVWRTVTFKKKVKVLIRGVEKEVTTTESYDKKTIQFWAVNSKTKKWGTETTWGGTLCENLVQACARDLMMWAKLRLEKKGYAVLLAVHDEIISEKKQGLGSVDEFTKIMCETPPWADELLPIDAKGWSGPRYRK